MADLSGRHAGTGRGNSLEAGIWDWEARQAQMRLTGNGGMTPDPPYSGYPETESALLYALDSVLTKVPERESVIIGEIHDLHKAIEEQNKPTIRKKVAALTKGAAATVLGPMLCKGLTKYLGLI